MGCSGMEEAKKVAMVHEDAESIIENGLSYGDKIVFGKFRYGVEIDHLNHFGGSNRAVLDDLGIEDPANFCTEHYGYTAVSGGWPECNDRDYEALARVAIAIFELIDGPAGAANSITKAAKEILKASKVGATAESKLVTLRKQIAEAEKELANSKVQIAAATQRMNDAIAQQAAA